jgi:hypothetical protein
MAAPQQRITHGSLATPVMTDYRVQRSVSDLDRGQIVYMCNKRGVFSVGGSPSMFPNLRIQAVDERNVAGDVEVTLNVEGLIDSNAKRVSLTWQEDPFDFDTANEEWIQLFDSTFTWGSAMTGNSNMRLVAVGQSYNLDGRWARKGYTYKGIRKAGLVDRQVTVNENIVSPSDPVTVNLPGGWDDPRQANISLPRVVLRETVKSTSPPDTDDIPSGNYVLPISGLSFPDVQSFSLSGSVTYNWPNGWKLANIDGKQLYAGVNIWVNTYVYEYVWLYQF